MFIFTGKAMKKILNKLLTILFCSLLVSTPLYAEYPKKISSLHLGMTFDEAKNIYPTLRKDDGGCELSTAFMSIPMKDNIAKKDAFLTIHFYENKIIRINYYKNYLKEIDRNIVMKKIREKYGSPLIEKGNILHYSKNHNYNYVEVKAYDKERDTQLVIAIDDETLLKKFRIHKKQCLNNKVSVPN